MPLGREVLFGRERECQLFVNMYRGRVEKLTDLLSPQSKSRDGYGQQP